MIKFELNLHKFNNYAFFCPVSRLHLTVSSPVGLASEVTPAILRGLKAKTILDVDGVIDLETGTVKAKEKAQPTPEPDKTENNKIKVPVEPVVETPVEEKPAETAKEEAVEQKEEEKQDKKVANKRGKRTEAAPVDEAK